MSCSYNNIEQVYVHYFAHYVVRDIRVRDPSICLESLKDFHGTVNAVVIIIARKNH